MTFMTFSFFLAGCAAVALPILLHLVMKGRPKREIFPTFGFIRKTARANRRRLTLKHLILLTLRGSILILLGLMLARPTLTLFSDGEEKSRRSERKTAPGALRPGTEGPVAAAILFDTSIRMDYRRNNLSRLDEAKSFARALIPRLPEGSRVAILDSLGDHDSFQIDLLAARDRMDRLAPGPERRPLAESVAAAIRLLETAETENREIFILTDRTAAGWPPESRERLRRLIHGETSGGSKKSDIDFYLADFSVPDASDAALAEITLSSGSVRGKGNATLHVDLTFSGEGKDGLLELYLVPPKGGNKTADRESDAVKVLTESFSAQDAPLSPDADHGGENRRRATFHLSDLEEGFYQGFIRKTPPDALAANDRIDFSFNVRSGGRILLIASEPTDEKTLFFREAIAPEAWRETGTAPFELETIPYSKFGAASPNLSDYRALLFLDVPPLSKTEWKRTADYVRSGGGAGFFFGRGAVPIEGFESPDASALLGGKPIRQVRTAEEGVFMIPTASDHSILARFRLNRRDQNIPWQDLPVFRYWRMEWNEGETPIEILRYSDGNPALLERPFGDGRVVISTTPFSDSPNDPGAWNLLTTGDHAWIFLILADGIARTLAGGEDRLNYEPFEIPPLHPNLKKETKSVTMILPDGRTVPIQIDETKRTVRFAGTGLVGSYRMMTDEATAQDRPSDSAEIGGFSVHYPPNSFDLTLLSPETLQKDWEPIPLTVVTHPDEIEFVRSVRRSGRDFFPATAILFALFFAVEVILSNRFYD